MKLSHAILRTMLTAMLAMFILTPAMAEPRAWQISESTGQVTINSAGASRPGTRGVLLKQGDAVATGPNSRAVLVRGSEFVMLSPNSQVRISKPKESGAITQIYQYLGSALFKIEKKETPHFGVKTPYLAAVVKGTTFNVTVTESGATVQVTEGRVEVSTLDGGAADLIVPGRIARVDANDRQLLRVLGTDDTAIRSPLPPQQQAVDEKKSVTTPAKGDDGSSDSNGQVSNDNVQADEQIDDTQITQSIADTGKEDGFDGRIGTPITGDNVSIAILTGGLISGSRDNDRVRTDVPANGNAGGNTDNPGNGNAGGNADVPANGNAGGNADNPGNGNAGGNADVPANGNAGGNADNPGNGNAGGNADNPGNGNAGGNADNPGNGNAGGNADNPGNGNAGGNADNPGNGNAGGNADDGGILDDVDDVVDDVVNPVKGKKDRDDD
jgi:FecR protein